MKKAIITFGIILTVFAFATNVGAVDIEDVPEDHWAYENVKVLVERGYISLYDDDTFAGSNRVSRYELAEVIANLLEDIHVGDTEVGEEDIDILRQLSLEFRDELVDVAADMDLFSERVDELEEEVLIQGEELAGFYETLDDVEREVAQMIDEIASLRAIEDEVENLEARIDDLDERYIDLEETAVAEVPEDIEDFQMDITNRLDTLDNRLTSLEEDQAESQEQIRALERQSSNYLLYIGAVGLISLLTLTM
ncbi:S-layer homology domain-containing protein [Halanaerobiaceae bacterium Z-7014]|uniref:S-layer homology domain-containing protein n=1 Tax=Halonatronomonas betaini TaxID=2778430 RepID=A0A931FB68_9FIRM|nr:S-layer homology domain-containing protein [Halonatronomonas betaini]